MTIYNNKKMELVEEIKKALELVYELLDSVEKMGGKPDFLEMPLRECFKTDVWTQCLYFASTDGEFKIEERDFINEIMDMGGSIETYINVINEHNIYSVEFENKNPLTLEILRDFDNKVSHLTNNKAVPKVLEWMKNICKTILVMDDDLDEDEALEFNTYFNRLEKEFISSETVLIKKNNNSSENSLKGYYLKKKK